MSLTYCRDFQNHHQWGLADNMFLNDVKTIFFYMFIMCFFFKGYNKDHGIESVISFHSKSFVAYIIYSNKPTKWYVLDTRVLFAKISCHVHYVDSTLSLGGLWILYKTWEMQLLIVTIYIMTLVLYAAGNAIITFVWK